MTNGMNDLHRSYPRAKAEFKNVHIYTKFTGAISDLDGPNRSLTLRYQISCQIWQQLRRLDVLDATKVGQVKLMCAPGVMAVTQLWTPPRSDAALQHREPRLHSAQGCNMPVDGKGSLVCGAGQSFLFLESVKGLLLLSHPTNRTHCSHLQPPFLWSQASLA